MLPKGVTALGIRVLRRLPDRALGLILPKRLRFDAAAIPEPIPSPDAPIRLFIGPVNFAGQSWQWARAAERSLDGVSAVTMAYTTGTGYGFPIDISVPASAYLLSSGWQRRQRRAVQGRFTHVIVEAGRHLFGRVYDETVADEIRSLQAAGVRVAMLTHGSDMRLPSRHAARHPDSPYRAGEWASTAALETEARRNRALLDEVGVPIFASTPGMLDDVPEAAWLPVVVDCDRWASDAAPLQRERPVVVHAPSSSIVKGSELIEPAVRALDEEGVIEYRRIEGIPAAQMPDVVRDADIVLDQFRLGDYGVAACEALAAGRLVIGNVDETARSVVRRETGLQLPIVESAVANLEAVLREVVADRSQYREIAARGAEFAREVHDGRFSARVLEPFLAGGTG
ncbi:hypothetical protein [Agromyces bauzanensis]